MLTPPTIGLTSSIVNDKLNNITLEDNNSTELFSVTSDNTAIQTKDNVPLQASQFIITGTNAEIDEDENNAVNKRYLVDKITPLDSKFMTQAQCDERYLGKANVIDTTLRPGDFNYNVYNTNVIDYKYYSKDTMDEKLGGKVNNDYLSQNYYDKGTIDSKLSENVFDANNYYDKDTLDNYLSLKADKNFVLANYYNRTDIDGKLALTATTAQLQALYQDTYSKGQVYNKTEIDDKITTINNNFGNYYTKTEVDTNMSTVNNNFSN